MPLIRYNPTIASDPTLDTVNILSRFPSPQTGLGAAKYYLRNAF